MPDWVDKILSDPELAPYAPDRPWSAAQREEHLLFLHYALDPDVLRPFVPPPLELQLYDGSAWVAIIALQMSDVCVRYVPMPPQMRNFPEIDFAALVTYQGRIGLYFISIEGAHWWTATIARLTTGLPYQSSGVRLERQGSRFHMTSGPRWSRGEAAAIFDASYEPSTSDYVPDPGSPIDLLAGQFSAYVHHWGKLREVDEVHGPWVLTEVDLDLKVNTIGDAAGLTLPARPTLQHYSVGRDIVSWLPQAVDKRRRGLAPPEAPGHEPVSET